jgi:hypothetical protein
MQPLVRNKRDFGEAAIPHNTERESVATKGRFGIASNVTCVRTFRGISCAAVYCGTCGKPETTQ